MKGIIEEIEAQLVRMEAKIEWHKEQIRRLQDAKKYWKGFQKLTQEQQ